MASMIQPHDLAVQCDLDRHHAVRVIRYLAKEGWGKVATLVYHGCSEAPVAIVRPYNCEKLPKVCPECEEEFDAEEKQDIALVKA